MGKRKRGTRATPTSSERGQALIEGLVWTGLIFVVVFFGARLYRHEYARYRSSLGAAAAPWPGSP
jgi:hypothetical protein